MASFGSIGFGTIEPGNGTLEEQICFTGITQNTNGTATLTGVSNVLFLAPYTRTSGLAKTHAGSTTFIISNTSGFYDRMVSKDDDEIITGTYTFTTPNYPQVDVAANVPTLPAQFATVQYVNSVAVSGAPNATPLVKGIVQIGTQAEVDSKAVFGTTSAYVVVIPSTLRSHLLNDYAVDTSTSANVIIIAPSPVITSYSTGQIFATKIANTSASPVVINVNGLGNKNVYKLNGSTSMAASDLISGQMIIVQYDGTNFQLLNELATTVAPPGTPTAGDLIYYGGTSGWVRLAAGTSPFVLTSNGPSTAPSWQIAPGSSFGNGTFTKNSADASTAQTIAHGLGKLPKFVSLRLRAVVNNTPGGMVSSESVYNGTTQSSTSVYFTGNFSITADTTFTLNTALTNGTQTGVVTYDATNITITWTKANSPTGTYTGIWEAYA